MPRKRHKAEEIVAVLVSSSLLLSLASYANVRAEFHLSNLSEFPETALRFSKRITCSANIDALLSCSRCDDRWRRSQTFAQFACGCR